MVSLLHPKVHLDAFHELVRLLTRHRQLTWEMTKRDLSDRYVGQLLGMIWAVGHPLALMGIYVLIFGYVFKLKVGGTRDLPLNYTVYLLSGIVSWMATQEAMVKGASAITASSNLVKQVVFPVEVLPVKGALAAAFTQSIYIALLLLYILVAYGFLHWTMLLVPVLLFFQILGMIGISYILSAISVYFRDTKDFVQVFCVAGMYIMPVFYLPKWVPGALRPLLYVNPFSYMVWCWQDCLYFGRFDHPWAWLLFPIGSIAVFYFGYRVFRKLKVSFGSLL